MGNQFEGNRQDQDIFRRKPIFSKYVAGSKPQNQNQNNPSKNSLPLFEKLTTTENNMISTSGMMESEQLKRVQTKGQVVKKIYNNGCTYQGKVNQANQANGFGVLKLPNGSFYQGNWFRNKAFGTGKFQGSNGQFYEGQWKNDKPFGKGFMKFSDGATYQGLFFDGLKNQIGKYTWPELKITYSGDWKYDVIEGRGHLYFADHREYHGDFKDNMFHGHGVYVWADGSKYVGEFFCNKKHGKGIYKWNDGRTFEGTWDCGLRQGEGVYTLANGHKRRGIWRRDIRTTWLE